MGIVVPRRGNRSSTPWESQFHAVELTVPKPGTHSPKAWNSQSQSLELAVPEYGLPIGTVISGYRQEETTDYESLFSIYKRIGHSPSEVQSHIRKRLQAVNDRQGIHVIAG